MLELIIVLMIAGITLSYAVPTYEHMIQYGDQQHGLCLIELLIVLTIISVLYAALYPAYTQYQYKTDKLNAQNVLLSLMLAQRLFYSQQHTYTDKLKDLQAEWVHDSALNNDAYEYQALSCENETIQKCIELRAIPRDATQLTLIYNSRNQKTHW